MLLDFFKLGGDRVQTSALHIDRFEPVLFQNRVQFSLFRVVEMIRRKQFRESVAVVAQDLVFFTAGAVFDRAVHETEVRNRTEVVSLQPQAVHGRKPGSPEGGCDVTRSAAQPRLQRTLAIVRRIWRLAALRLACSKMDRRPENQTNLLAFFRCRTRQIAVNTFGLSVE